MPLVALVAWHMALVPLAWLAFRHERRIEWWWLAAAFFVSWLADAVALLGNPWIPATVYPVSQAAIVVAVLAPRLEARIALGTLIAAGLLTVLIEGIGPGLFLETVVAGVVVGIVWPLALTRRLRTALLVAFGGGWLAWVGYVLAPGWESWGAYQAVRALGLGLFCWASMRPALRLA